MGKLDVRKIVKAEFKKEFSKLRGRQSYDKVFEKLTKQFDLKSVQKKVDKDIAEKEGEPIRNYHRNNLRYLAKYYAEMLHNQLKSSKVSLPRGVKNKQLLKDTLRVFKANPQCKVYH